MTDRIKVKCKESFKQGIQYAFVMADLLREDWGAKGWINIDPYDVLSCEFRDSIADKLYEYFEQMIQLEEQNNWPDYKFRSKRHE